MEKKNLYYEFSDGADCERIVMELSNCVAFIEADMDGRGEEDTDDREYTIKPVWLTNRQFEDLPEAD